LICCRAFVSPILLRPQSVTAENGKCSLQLGSSPLEAYTHRINRSRSRRG
jgi:hypothetical protein